MGQVGPRLLQMCSNKAPESSKMARRCHKMVPRWPQHGPRWSKMFVSGCLWFSSWASSGTPWLCLRSAFVLHSLCFRVAFALPSLCLRFAFVLPSLCLCLPNGGVPEVIYQTRADNDRCEHTSWRYRKRSGGAFEGLRRLRKSLLKSSHASEMCLALL